MKTASELLQALKDKHPYRQPGNLDSYSDYNQGWSDALDCAEQVMERAMKDAYNKGLQDAAESAVAYDTVPRAYCSCKVDKDSILKLKK